MLFSMGNGSGFTIITSTDVARLLGISHEALGMYLSRNPDLRPKGRISGDDLLWTPEEVERLREVREARASKRKTKTE